MKIIRNLIAILLIVFFYGFPVFNSMLMLDKNLKEMSGWFTAINFTFVLFYSLVIATKIECKFTAWFKSQIK
jgi:hypothetical protein